MHAIITRLASLLTLFPVLPLLFNAASGLSYGYSDQITLLANSKEYETRSFSVGFSLQSSYGAVALIFDDSEDGGETITRTFYGDAHYRHVMARLSLSISRHIAPPYGLDDQYYLDLPRKAARTLNKKLGLPASPDVGALASVIKQLRYQIESEFGVRVASATVAVPHLVALYQDDVEDACEHAGIEYVNPKDLFEPLFWETSAAYAGYGLGLCEHYMDEPRCDEENGQLPTLSVFSVHYSRAALTTSLAVITNSNIVWDPDTRRTEDFTLGNDAILRYPSEDAYWADVKGALLEVMIENPMYTKPEKIILTGDMVHGTFMRILRETMEAHIGHVPPIWADDAMVVAAKGAAEQRRRTPPYFERN